MSERCVSMTMSLETNDELLISVVDAGVKCVTTGKPGAHGTLFLLSSSLEADDSSPGCLASLGLECQ